MPEEKTPSQRMQSVEASVRKLESEFASLKQSVSTLTKQLTNLTSGSTEVKHHTHPELESQITKLHASTQKAIDILTNRIAELK